MTGWFESAASTPREQKAGRGATGSRGGVSLELQLWITVGLLMGFGLVMIYSASAFIALKRMSNATYYAERQLLFVGLGVIIMVATARIPYQWYFKHSRWMLALALASLALVLIPGVGVEINSARRWFQVKSFNMQPAEYAKVIWVIYLSGYLTRQYEQITRFSIGLLLPALMCSCLGALLLMQPDFGTALMLGILTSALLLAGGVRRLHLLTLIPPAAGLFYLAVYQVSYRWERVTAFLNPWTDRLDSGYQLIQAWIAVGSGGYWGVGLGAGQQKLFYLPEPYTDFILAVIGEELGFLGILGVCMVFLVFFQAGIRISESAPDRFGCLLALGLTMLITLQAVINMGVVLGLFPTKGLPLPFVSYGGSAFTANCLAIGILINIARVGSQKSVQN